MISIAEGNLNYSDHKSVYIHGTTHILYMCTVLSVCLVIGGKMQDYFLESLKLPRLDFFVKLVAASECDDEEKRLAIQWVSELTDELMAKIRAHEYNRSMDLPS